MPLTWTTSCELYPSTSLGFFSLFSRSTLESRDSWLRGNIPLFLESAKRHIPSSCEKTGAEVSWRDRLSPDPNVLSTVEKVSAYFVSEMNQEKSPSYMALRKPPQQMCLEATSLGDHRNTTKFIVHISSVDEPKATLERTNQNRSHSYLWPWTVGLF